MKERKGIFKDYSIEKFWPMFVSQITDNMILASTINGGDKTKNPQILMSLAELMWPIYEKIFKSKYKFYMYINLTTLGILDAYESGVEISDVKKVFDIIKKNWNKNYKYMVKTI